MCGMWVVSEFSGESKNESILLVLRHIIFNKSGTGLSTTGSETMARYQRDIMGKNDREVLLKSRMRENLKLCSVRWWL